MIANLEKTRRTNASDTKQLKDLEVERQQLVQKICDELGLTKEEIKNKNLAVAVNVNGGNGDNNGNGNGNGGGGSLFDPAGNGKPNGGFMPWERNRAEGPASNNTDNQNGGVFARPKDWIKHNAKTHAKLWRQRGWDPDTGKPLEEEKKAQVDIGDTTMNQLKKIIQDAQKPHIMK